MQLPQPEWEVLRKRVNSVLERSLLTPKELAEKTGIDYFAARRILRSGIQNQTSAARRVANELLSLEAEQLQRGARMRQQVHRVVDDYWDGTEEGVSEIIKYLKSLKARR